MPYTFAHLIPSLSGKLRALIRPTAVVYLILGLVYFFNCLSQLEERVTWHWANSNVEAQPVWASLRVANKQTLYIDYTSTFPAVPLTYGALSYLMPGKIANTFNLYDARSVTRILRLFAAVSFFGLLITISLLCKQRQFSSIQTLLACGIIFWFPYMCEWSGKGLPDFPALFCSLLGWYVLGNRPDRTLLRVIFGIAIWTIGWHFKPIVTAGIIAYLCENIFLKKPHSLRENLIAIMPIVGFIIAIISTSIFAIIATDGKWVQHILGSAGEVRWSGTEIGAILKFAPESWLIPGVILFGAMYLRKYRIAVALCLEASIASILILKEGANINYYLGSVVLFSLLVSNILAKASGAKLIQNHPYICSYFLVILILNLPSSSIFMKEMPKVSLKEVNKIASAVENSTTKPLCLNPYYALVYGLPCPFMDGFHAVLLERDQIVSFQSWAEAIEAGHFPVIVGDYYMYGKPPLDGNPLIPVSIHKSLRRRIEFITQGEFLCAVRYRDRVL